MAHTLRLDRAFEYSESVLSDIEWNQYSALNEEMLKIDEARKRLRQGLTLHASTAEHKIRKNECLRFLLLVGVFYARMQLKINRMFLPQRGHFKKQRAEH